jgi:isopentenyl-diphosphate delta-isomerase
MQEKNTSAPPPDRKLDHIELAFRADMSNQGPDPRFYYEPMLSGHPSKDADIGLAFLGKKLLAPLWVSSMTGGTEKAYTINHRLAEACAKFGLGMGLGSCRSLLEGNQRLGDFDVRSIIGPDLPFYANLGIAQVEQLFAKKETNRLNDLIHLLRADGLIIHINPLQEWLQPEGDLIEKPPIETLQQVLESVSFPIIVKEVGQGMGPESIISILKLPVAAFELAAHGGTNFSKLELLRSDSNRREAFDPVAQVGHTAHQMVDWINTLTLDMETVPCQQFIISGGVRDFLDGYYLTQKLRWPAIYGQASGFLRYATESQSALDEYITQQIRGLRLAQTYLRIR